MGRPREHDDHTAALLLAAAERAVEDSGPDALSVRGVAGDVGTTTRAVYSLFGSKDGLIAALGAQAFEFLRAGLEALPQTGDPAADLVETGLVFRRLAVERPALYSIGVERSARGLPSWQVVCDAADAAFAVLSSTSRDLTTPVCSASRPSPRPRSSSTPCAKGSPPSSGATQTPARTGNRGGHPRSRPRSQASPPNRASSHSQHRVGPDD